LVRQPGYLKRYAVVDGNLYVKQPSLATIKRLFAVSGNVCAFPGCKSPLVDHPSGKVTARICHIKARSEGGPRYDAAQADLDRHGFDNLVLLCPSHHDVIDADSVSYSVERLLEIKSDHERDHATGQPVSDAVAKGLLASIESNVVSDGSVVTTVNQTGGQTAHSITNIGDLNITQTIVTQYEATRRKKWRPLEHLNYAVLQDSENSRGAFLSSLALGLHAIYADEGYTDFNAIFSINTVERDGYRLGVYALTTHKARFCNNVREKYAQVVSEMLSAKESGDASKTTATKERLTAEIEQRADVFKDWRIETGVVFATEPMAVRFIYDPDTKYISIKSIDNFSLGSDRHITTSAVLHMICGFMTHRVALIDGLDELIKDNYTTTKLLLDVLDGNQINLDGLRVNVDDDEEWDYSNAAFDARFQNR
jgi:hypothetical protein